MDTLPYYQYALNIEKMPLKVYISAKLLKSRSFQGPNILEALGLLTDKEAFRLRWL